MPDVFEVSNFPTWASPLTLGAPVEGLWGGATGTLGGSQTGLKLIALPGPAVEHYSDGLYGLSTATVFMQQHDRPVRHLRQTRDESVDARGRVVPQVQTSTSSVATRGTQTTLLCWRRSRHKGGADIESHVHRSVPECG